MVVTITKSAKRLVLCSASLLCVNILSIRQRQVRLCQASRKAVLAETLRQVRQQPGQSVYALRLHSCVPRGKRP